VARTTRKAPSIPYVSNVTGTWITAAEATDPAYWAKHLRQPVLFATGIRALLGDSRRALLEVGPGATLTTLARQNSPGSSTVVLQTMPRAQEKETDCAALLGALGRLWLAGVSVDFARVNAGEKRRRVALPAYPFDRKRFWVDPARAATDRRPRQSPMARLPRVDQWCYAPAWKASSADLRPSAPARWLVLADESPLARAVVSDLSASAADVIQVIAGEWFERRNRHTFVVGTDLQADYERIFNELHADGRAIDRIALLPVRAAGEGEPGFYSLLFLLQALGSSRCHKVTKLVVGTAHARPVTGAEQLNTSDATMLGLCRVASQEFPGMSCTTVDVDPPADPEHAHQIAVRLVRELTSDAADSVVAWRGYKRWVLGFDEVAVAAGTAPRLRNDGVYLITGGLGRVGLTLARRLAREGARLVLTATSSLPARERWEALTAETATDTVLERVRAIRAIEQAGASVTVEAVDVSAATR
jgi:acyl transferase domain-containing protein